MMLGWSGSRPSLNASSPFADAKILWFLCIYKYSVLKNVKLFYPFCPMTISFHEFLYLFVPLHRVLIINYPLSIRTALLGQNGPLLSAIHFDIYLRFDKKIAFYLSRIRLFYIFADE